MTRSSGHDEVTLTTAADPTRPWWLSRDSLLVFLGLAAVTAGALYVRYKDILANPVLAAEDPYTQVLLTREDLLRGYFGESHWLGMKRLYPVGLAALLGTMVATTGFDTFALAQYGAPILGAIGVLGIAVFAWREAGAVAGITAGALLATAPEHVFRSNLWVPTALDLALIPWYLMAVVAAMRGNRVWTFVAFALGLAMTLAHPWTSTLIVAATGAYILFFLIAKDGSNARVRDAVGVMMAATAIAVVGLLDVLAQDADKGVAMGAYAIVAASGLGLTALLLITQGGGRFRVALPDTALRGLVGTLAGAGLAAGVFMAMASVLQTPPDHVNYVHMMRLPLVATALLGLALILPTRTPLGLMGLAFAAVTVPLTLWDLFDLWYLPHRTMAYVTIAAALIAANGLQSIASWGPGLIARTRPTARPSAILAAIIILVVPAVAAENADHAFEWHRYYDGPSDALLRKAIEDTGTGALVVGSWQASLIGKSYAGDPPLVHYRPEYFMNPVDRQALIDRYPSPLYVFVDAYVVKKTGYDESFLHTGEYELVAESGPTRLYRLHDWADAGPAEANA